MGSKYAISDIHGCLKTFRHLVEDIVQFKESDTLYLLGDYVDRGPDSKGVIDYILQLKEKHTVHTLLGNHEEMMVNCLLDHSLQESWLRYGGKETLKSFGVSDIHDIPEMYWIFINSCKYFIEEDQNLLVHAGFNFDKDPFQDFEAMLWTRSESVDLEKSKGRKVIHGHTPKSIHSIQFDLELDGPNVCIDAGCVFNLKNGIQLGQMACLNLQTYELSYVDRIDKSTSKE